MRNGARSSPRAGSMTLRRSCRWPWAAPASWESVTQRSATCRSTRCSSISPLARATSLLRFSTCWRARPAAHASWPRCEGETSTSLLRCIAVLSRSPDMIVSCAARLKLSDALPQRSHSGSGGIAMARVGQRIGIDANLPLIVEGAPGRPGSASSKARDHRRHRGRMGAPQLRARALVPSVR